MFAGDRADAVEPRDYSQLKWDHAIHLCGRGIKDPLLHLCEVCSLPILIYGRMVSICLSITVTVEPPDNGPTLMPFVERLSSFEGSLECISTFSLSFELQKRCRHAFCRDCAKKAGGVCPKCKEGDQTFEEASMGSVYICTHAGGRYTC